ncbi:hypothetical protein ACIBAH_22220 [Streptomyces sp. NPDC051445]|uniref:hypothetical protein n=1 Tax=unclassified Streptomyces TaxID=2593676 RepID=UPI0037BA9983
MPAADRTRYAVPVPRRRHAARGLAEHRTTPTPAVAARHEAAHGDRIFLLTAPAATSWPPRPATVPVARTSPAEEALPSVSGEVS